MLLPWRNRAQALCYAVFAHTITARRGRQAMSSKAQCYRSHNHRSQRAAGNVIKSPMLPLTQSPLAGGGNIWQSLTGDTPAQSGGTAWAHPGRLPVPARYPLFQTVAWRYMGAPGATARPPTGAPQGAQMVLRTPQAAIYFGVRCSPASLRAPPAFSRLAPVALRSEPRVLNSLSSL